jgi:hypothetical protein
MLAMNYIMNYIGYEANALPTFTGVGTECCWHPVPDLDRDIMCAFICFQGGGWRCFQIFISFTSS